MSDYFLNLAKAGINHDLLPQPHSKFAVPEWLLYQTSFFAKGRVTRLAKSFGTNSTMKYVPDERITTTTTPSPQYENQLWPGMAGRMASLSRI